MKNKNFEKLFFSKTRDFLDGYLTKQCSRSPHTVKAYRYALTVFRKYVSIQGLSLKTFDFQDCTRDFLLGFMEHLQKEGYERSSCNQRLAAIKSYMWYVPFGTFIMQQTFPETLRCSLKTLAFIIGLIINLLDPAVSFGIKAEIEFCAEFDGGFYFSPDNGADVRLADAHDPMADGMAPRLVHLKLLSIEFPDGDVP